MSLADWLAHGADPAQMTSEEVRRQRELLAVREEQATSKLERLIAERDDLFERGAKSSSPVLRRVLARRHTRVHADVRGVERDLARVGKELAGLAAVGRLLREGTTLEQPGDCTPLLTLLDDASAEEDEFADLLRRRLIGDAASDMNTGPIVVSRSRVLESWEKLDRGEFESVDDARRAFESQS